MDVSKSALIVVDINRTHFDLEFNYLPVPADDAARVLDRVGNVVMPVFRHNNLPVIFVQTIHRKDPLTGEAMSVASPFWKHQMEKRAITGVGQKRKTLAVKGSPAVEIMPQLEVREDDFVVVKQRYSPFVATDLEMALRVMDVKTLFLVGANTNNCVLSTAFEAFNRDFAVVLVEDCCASMNGKDYHELAVKQIKTSIGWVIASNEVEGVLSGNIKL